MILVDGAYIRLASQPDLVTAMRAVSQSSQLCASLPLALAHTCK